MPLPRVMSQELRPSRIALEIGIIVVGVLLALGANQWREARADRELATKVLETVRAEVAANQGELRDAIERRGRVIRWLDLGDEAQGEDAEAGDIDYRPALLRNAAWETAQSTGAAGLLDFEISWRLSEIHQLQSLYRDLAKSFLETFYLGELLGPSIADTPQRTRRAIVPILYDMRALEATILDRYNQLAEMVGTSNVTPNSADTQP